MCCPVGLPLPVLVSVGGGCVYGCVCVSSYVRVRVSVYLRLCGSVSVHVRPSVCLSVCVSVPLCVNTHMCLYACVCLCVRVSVWRGVSVCCVHARMCVRA